MTSYQRQKISKTPQIGDVFLMSFRGTANEQRGFRPGLIFQNNLANKYSPNVIALPLTTSLKKQDQPTHVLLPAAETGLARDSMVLCENPERMAKERLSGYITTIPAKYMSMVAEASLLATSAISFIDPQILLSLWQKAIELNAESLNQ